MVGERFHVDAVTSFAAAAAASASAASLSALAFSAALSASDFCEPNQRVRKSGVGQTHTNIATTSGDPGFLLSSSALHFICGQLPASGILAAIDSKA